MTDRPLVLLATCAELPAGDPDDAELVDAFAAAGIAAEWAVWDDAAVDWTAGLTLLRSTWDYTLRREQFLTWVDRLPAVHNAAAVVRWNSDKRYLLELAAAGLPVTPTVLVEPGSPLRLPTTADVVVKPSVGAGSRGAGRFAGDDVRGLRNHVERLHAARRTVLLQPYLAEVDSAGETAVVAVGGRVDHAARKGPMLRRGRGHDVVGASLFIEEDITPRTVSPREREVAEAALAFLDDRFGGPLLYARIDLLPSPDGPLIVELELAEPSLFFGCSDGAARRFAAAVAEAACRVPPAR